VRTLHSTARVALWGSAIFVGFDGWQVWSGEYGDVKVGNEIVSSIEFTERGAVTELPADRPTTPRRDWVGRSTYRATAEVVEVGESVVLDLGDLKVMQWARPTGAADRYRLGEHVELELDLGLNAWNDAPWVYEVARRHDVVYRLRVDEIASYADASSRPRLVEKASRTTVPDTGYCMLRCVRVD
jgi:hypothetical protein